MSFVAKNIINATNDSGRGAIGGSFHFWFAKRCFDILVSLALLPLLGIAAIALLVLNPFLNPGRLFYVQVRMGRDCRAFKVYKFRTMRVSTKIHRRANDPIESDRITPFGKILRTWRIDELPQILNVMMGQMSLIGPRPDYFHHARSYARIVPNYRCRHRVRPGISGLAQVTHGYAEGFDATHNKVVADLAYIQNAGFKLDALLVLQTIRTIVMRVGA